MTRRLPHAVLLAALGGLFALAVHVDFPLCPLAGTFGIPCPGCGLTRATLALLHGHLHAALHLHPLVWLLAPLSLGFFASVGLELLRGPKPPPPTSRTRRLSARLVALGSALLLALTLGVWAARFAGYFGGPAPVTSLRDWLSERYLTHH